MSRKPHPHRGAKQKRLQRQQQQRLDQLKLFLIVSVVINVVLMGAAGMFAMQRTSGGTAHAEGLPATLPPENFDGRTRDAYQVAIDIPAVLDGAFCYCYCKEQHGHRSLLGCYIDNHAAICDVCQDEALRAQELWDEGMPIYDISEQLDKEFEPEQ